MNTTKIEPDEFKRILKTAIGEVLEERRDWVRDIVAEALEDIALRRAVDEGLESRPVSREDVFAVLENRI